MADLYRQPDSSSGMFGESDAPDNCINCGVRWEASERLHTGDPKGIGGWEDWMYCGSCKQEWFYPVVRCAAGITAKGEQR